MTLFDEQDCSWNNRVHLGQVPERLKGPVSKTGVVLVATVGSNPTLSAFLRVAGTRGSGRQRDARRSEAPIPPGLPEP